MYPTFRNLTKDFLQAYFRGSFLWRLPATSQAVALTFDDGPHAELTPVLLDLLTKYEIVATFFVIGAHARKNPAVMRRIAAEGHGLGGHTFNHRELVSLSSTDLAAELSECREAIRDITGVDTALCRPPRGKVDLKSLRRVSALGYQLVHWNRTYSDYRMESADMLLASLRASPVKPRDIVLLHDTLPVTGQALAIAMPEWNAAGLRFVRI